MEDGNQSMAMNETLFCDCKDAISVRYFTPVHEGKPLGESCCDQVALIFAMSILCCVNTLQEILSVTIMLEPLFVIIILNKKYASGGH